MGAMQGSLMSTWPSRVTTNQGQGKRSCGRQVWRKAEIGSDSVKSFHFYGESRLGHSDHPGPTQNDIWLMGMRGWGIL
jgi:hypothetical protein